MSARLLARVIILMMRTPMMVAALDALSLQADACIKRSRMLFTLSLVGFGVVISGPMPDDT